ncbi:uncharacterized protein CDV56_107074 [Aspergillus thermomutatus]|uniref:Uncharacterized protein n=1 Tax=Aspergillus thermomutatus TaxID=41047 RepID=A0A397GV05_ASPTH|nr:uncharacterized protein CDV56_107074 [Aspergillus thermomutatus]RHZ54861.1 hypothetical protein CDV56_107074 [Aspergillus thermomutatus]
MNMTHLSGNDLRVALRAAARALIWSLQAMPELQEARIVIIGGMAVQHHVGAYRKTSVSTLKNRSQRTLTRSFILVQDVDVLLFSHDHPIDTQRIRKELVSGFSYLFMECAQPLFFKYRDTHCTHLVQVDLIPQHLPPYLPAHAMALREIDLNYLPFIVPLDLIAYKVHCSSMRPYSRKRKQDARDARMLWGMIYSLKSVPLSQAQRQAIISGLDLMAGNSGIWRWLKGRLRRWVNIRQSACNQVERVRLIMEREESALHKFPRTRFTPPGDLFVTSVGVFGEILAAQPYMKTRLVLAYTMSRIRTVESLEAQLDHHLDLLRLCRGDSMNVRGRVPALMLRLDKDQKCYEFLKWHAVIASEENWEPTHWNLSYLNIKKADAFESIELFVAGFPDLYRIVALTLLKIKLLLHLMRLEETALVLSPKLPPELVDLIQSFVPRSPIVAGNRELVYGATRQPAIEKLEIEIDVLCMATNLRNVHFWSSLLNPERNSTVKPNHHHWGTVEEARAIIMSVYDAWDETPGAIDFIRKKSQGRA